MAKRIERIDIESGDVFKGIKDSATGAKSEVDLLAETLKVVTEQINQIKTKAKDIKINVNASNLTDIEAQNKAEKEALRLAKQREKLDKVSGLTKKQMQSAEQSLQRQREKGLRQMEKENSAYAQASKRLNDLRHSYKDLAIAGRENESASRKMKREIDSLDKSLKKIDKTVGQSQRFVGEYERSFSKLSGALGVFGVSLGIGAVVKGAFNTIRDFDQSLANLASVLGTTADQIPKLEENAKKLGATTRFTATQVSELQTELAKLGFTENEILNATDGVLALAGATGTDLARSAEVAGSTLRGFGIDASEMGRIVDVMAKSFSTSALDTEKFAESMKVVAPIAKSAGVSLEETTAMLGALANAGISGSNAGTALRRILAEVATTGKPVKEAFKELAEKGLDLAGAEDEVGKNAMSALLILNEQNGKIQELTETYQNAEGEAQKMADTQLNTLAGSIDLLNSAWDGYIMSLNDASGAGEGIAKSIKFIADNLPTIIGLIAKLTVAFVTFKLVQGAVNTNFKELLKNFTSLKTSTTEGAQGLTKFGSALKGIGWTVAIGLAVELAKVIYDVVSGTAEAEIKMEAYNKAIERGRKIGEKYNSVYSEYLENKRNELRLLVAEGKISEEESQKRLKQINEISVNHFKAQRRRIDGIKAEQQALITLREAELSQINVQTSPIEYGKLTAEITLRKSKIKELNEILKSIIPLEKQQSSAVFEATIQEKENTKATTENNKAKKEKKEINKELIKQLGLVAFWISQQKEELVKLLDVERLSLEIAGQRLEQLDDETNLRRQNVARIKVLQAEASGNESEIRKARIDDIKENLAIELEDVEKNEVEKLRLKLEAEAQIRDIEKESLDKRRAERRKFTEDVLNEMKNISDEEMKLIDERIKAEQDLQSNLQAQANAGSIEAQQSIEASKEAEKKATLEKQKEQQKQQRIEDVKTLLNLINQYIDKGDNVATATTKGIAGLGIIKAIAKGLSGFATGTEWRLGDEHRAQMSGTDGHIVRVDSSEAIIKGSLMDKAESVGIGSTDELVKLAVMQKMNDGTNGFNPSMQVGYKINTSGIERRLESIEKAIQNKTETTFDPYLLNGLAKGITKTERKGNDIRRQIFKG